MSKLVRLIGDSNFNNTLIKNSFATDILLQKGAKLSVRSVHADLNPEDVQDVYEIAAGANTFSWKLQGDSDYMTVTIPVGSYEGIYGLLSAMTIAMNSTDVTDPTDLTKWTGFHSRWSHTNSYVSCEIYKATTDEPDFNTLWNWYNAIPLTTLTADSIGSNGTGAVLGYLPLALPLIMNRFDATMTTLGHFSLNAVDSADTNKIYYGASHDGTAYTLSYMDDTGSLATSVGVYVPQANDAIQLLKHGNTVTLTVVNGTPQETLTATLGQPALNAQSLFYQIGIPIGQTTRLDLCRCAVLDHYDPNSNGSASIDVDLRVPHILGGKLGFDAVLHKASGDPAIITGRNAANGSLNYPGIYLTIDGIPLESYAGSQTYNGSVANILDVMPTSNNGRLIRYHPNYPIKMATRNVDDQVLRDITVKFERGDTGSQTALPPLRFHGKPVVVIEISE